MRRLLEAMDSMSKAEKKSTGPKFPGYWKGTDPASKSRSRMVGGAEESIIKDLHNTAKEKVTEWELEESLKNFKDKEQQSPEADYGDEYQSMVSRVGKLAKEGPRKTVWDPVKRVYKNVPADDKKPVKEQEPSVQGREAIKTVSDWAERLRVAHELQKDPRLMADAEAKAAVQQRVRELLKHGIQQGYVK